MMTPTQLEFENQLLKRELYKTGQEIIRLAQSLGIQRGFKESYRRESRHWQMEMHRLKCALAALMVREKIKN